MQYQYADQVDLEKLCSLYIVMQYQYTDQVDLEKKTKRIIYIICSSSDNLNIIRYVNPEQDHSLSR